MFKYKDTKNNECYVCAVKYNFLPNKFRFPDTLTLLSVIACYLVCRKKLAS